MDSLHIFYDNRMIAQLQRKDEDVFDLIYTSEWKQNGFAFSPRLPLHGNYSPKDVKNFFLNLLPEGDALDTLSKLCQISKSNSFGLLRAIGAETSGALSFGMGSMIETSFRPVSLEELEERIRHRAKTPITLWDEKVRLSLAGVQEKLPIVYMNQQFGFGEGDFASTHILKFSHDNTLVLNEFLSLELAKMAKLPVNQATIQILADEPVLMVERFDRKIDPTTHTVKKHHVIDGCQLLSMSPSYKYERNFGSGRDVKDIREGVSFQRLMLHKNSMQVPALFIQQFIDWSLINLCLGNSDAHGKNISFFIDAARNLSLTPFYDIVNIHLYPHYAHELAMAFGDEFEIGQIKAYDLAYHCRLLNIKPALLITRFHTITKQIHKGLETRTLMDPLLEINAPFCEQYTQDVLTRIEKLNDVFEAFKGNAFEGYF